VGHPEHQHPRPCGVGPPRHRLPRHPPHFLPSFPDVNDILRRGKASNDYQARCPPDHLLHFERSFVELSGMTRRGSQPLNPKPPKT